MLSFLVKQSIKVVKIGEKKYDLVILYANCKSDENVSKFLTNDE